MVYSWIFDLERMVLATISFTIIIFTGRKSKAFQLQI
jgi:hypothetical protein